MLDIQRIKTSECPIDKGRINVTWIKLDSLFYHGWNTVYRIHITEILPHFVSITLKGHTDCSNYHVCSLTCKHRSQVSPFLFLLSVLYQCNTFNLSGPFDYRCVAYIFLIIWSVHSLSLPTTILFPSLSHHSPSTSDSLYTPGEWVLSPLCLFSGGWLCDNWLFHTNDWLLHTS